MLESTVHNVFGTRAIGENPEEAVPYVAASALRRGA